MAHIWFQSQMFEYVSALQFYFSATKQKGKNRSRRQFGVDVTFDNIYMRN
jgi:hypothetical protein